MAVGVLKSHPFLAHRSIGGSFFAAGRINFVDSVVIHLCVNFFVSRELPLYTKPLARRYVSESVEGNKSQCRCLEIIMIFIVGLFISKV